jgi:hypothetical protein
MEHFWGVNESPMDSPEDVIDAIEEAFRGVPLGKITLHEAEAMDRYSFTDADLRAAREIDPERDWRDIADTSIQECPDALAFLDPVSWSFYLPAYIRYGLRHLDEFSNSAIDSAIYSLDPTGIRQSDQRTRERFEILDVAQVRAVCSFLSFASRNGKWCDDVVAKDALDDYWTERNGV